MRNYTHTEMSNLSIPTNSFFFLEFKEIICHMPCATTESFIIT